MLRGTLRLIPEAEVTADQLRRFNVVLFGTPGAASSPCNPICRNVSSFHPAGHHRLRCRAETNRHIVTVIAPPPGASAAAPIGWDIRGAVSVRSSTNPPSRPSPRQTIAVVWAAGRRGRFDALSLAHRATQSGLSSLDIGRFRRCFRSGPARSRPRHMSRCSSIRPASPTTPPVPRSWTAFD